MFLSVYSQISILVCLLGCGQLIDSSVEPPKTTYAVIIDCGSSGTRAHLYQWDTDLEYPELLNDIEPMRDQNGNSITKKILPGLSSVQDDPDKSSDYMKPLIDFITDKIPESSHDSTAIYIMGTAGMRLLDQKTQLKIMNDIVQDLKTRFRFAKVVAKVITGSEEGMYEWITVNSKSKRFLNEIKRVADKTQAIIEMGGSSIQVTYQMGKDLRDFMEKLVLNWSDQPQEALKAFQSQIVKPQFSDKAGGGAIELFSASFLGLGGNNAREAYVDLLIDLARGPAKKLSRFFKSKPKSESRTSLRDPCLPKGASETIARPLKMLSSKTQTIGFNIEPNDKTFANDLIGTGEYSKCRQLLKELLLRAKKERMNCDKDKPCALSLLGNPFLPFGIYKILGLSEFYYTTSSMMNLAGRYDRKSVVRKAQKICETPYDKLLKSYPNANKIDANRVREECFKAAWIDTILSDGFGMPDGYPDFETVGKIKGDEIGWTMGAALDNSFAIENAVEDFEERELSKQI